MQRQNTIKDYDTWGIESCRLRLTLVLRKRVDWDVGFLAGNGFRSDQPERNTLPRCKKNAPPYNSPLLQVLESIDQNIKIKCVWTVEIILICMSLAVFLGSQRLVERILQLQVRDETFPLSLKFADHTSDRITTQGKFRDLTISIATEVLPEPEQPAIPIMLRSCHGGE